MCFDHDSLPTLEPISGGAIAHERLALTAADGNRFAVFRADAAAPASAAAWDEVLAFVQP